MRQIYLGTMIQWITPEDITTRFIVRLAALVCLLVPVCSTGEAKGKDVVEGDDKPLVMLVFDQNCKAWCSRVKPMMSEFQQEYGDKVMFAQVDATESVWTESKKQVKQLGVMAIFDLAGLSTFIEHVGQFDWNLNFPLWRPESGADLSFPGPMLPDTASAFVLLGLALALFGIRVREFFPYQILAILAGLPN
jgi:hypothetical protein